MLPSIIVKTHPKPLRLCPPLVNHWWGLPWVTALILSSPSSWRTSRGFHHQFQAAACSQEFWTTLSLPQILPVPLWSYSSASPWASYQRHLCMYISLYVWMFSYNRLSSWSAKWMKRMRLLVPLEFCVSAAFFALICISGPACLHICIHIYIHILCVCVGGWEYMISLSTGCT